MNKGLISHKHNSFTNDIPITVALKAPGVQSDKETLLFCARNTKSYQRAFSLNLEEAVKLGIFTTQQAREWIGDRTRVIRKVAGPRRAWSH